MLWQWRRAMVQPMRFSSLFTSRWMAIAWALLTCLSALGFVGGWSNSAASLQQQDDTAMQALNGANQAN